MNKPSNVIKVRDIHKKNYPGLPARSTIYKLHSLRLHPSLIYTVPGVGLCIDLDEWTAMCEQAKQKSIDRAHQVRHALAGR